MTNKVCFIILHYGENKEITKKAIKAIKSLSFDGAVDIIVVCNGKKYDISEEINTEVNTLVLENNEGFSKGNNVGYAYAKSKDDYDFMIIINNDIFIEQIDFISKLYNLYETHPFFVAGPDVYIPFKDKHTSPMSKEIPTPDEIEDIIQEQKNSLFEYEKSFSLKCFLSYISESYKNREKLFYLFRIRRKVDKKANNYRGFQENVILHGPCLIFSRDYISINKKAFDPEVFLYNEEFYLAYRCKKNNWRTIYSDELQVSHIHHGSTGITNLSYKKFCERKIENIKIRIAANEQLKCYIESNCIK